MRQKIQKLFLPFITTVMLMLLYYWSWVSFEETGLIVTGANVVMVTLILSIQRINSVSAFYMIMALAGAGTIMGVISVLNTESRFEAAMGICLVGNLALLICALRARSLLLQQYWRNQVSAYETPVG